MKGFFGAFGMVETSHTSDLLSRDPHVRHSAEKARPPRRYGVRAAKPPLRVCGFDRALGSVKIIKSHVTGAVCP